MPDGIPPTTSATPGTTAIPSRISRTSMRRPAIHGSNNDRNTGPRAMQVTATDALASLIAAKHVSQGSDRKSVVKGTSVSVRVDLGGRRTIKTKNKRYD